MERPRDPEHWVQGITRSWVAVECREPGEEDQEVSLGESAEEMT